MTFKEYEKRNNEAIKNAATRKKQKGEFTWDGIVAASDKDYSEWQNAPVKILFLLKEAFGGYHPGIPTEISKSFHLNMARWKYLIWELSQTGKLPNYPSTDLLREKYNNINTGIAIIEAKKYNEEKKTSSNTEIIEYAKMDKVLIDTQIEIINPEVIICCGTFDAYSQGIYEDESSEIKLLSYVDDLFEEYGIHGSILLHRGRLVVNFYHPSWPKSPEGYFELLGKLFQKSKGLKKIK